MSQDSGQDIPKIQVDDDWKKQAQAEKQRLASEQAEEPLGGTPPLPEPSFSSLVSRIAMEVSLYLGDVRIEGAESTVNPEMAKFNIDLLQVLEEKTRGNLSDEEKRLLDSVLYELRMRYVQRVSGGGA
jgi:hypothetical protein